MKPLLGIVAASVAFCLSLNPAAALTLDRQEVVCPFDGTAFEVNVITSMTQFGVNLDLKPYGALLAPAPLADCPTDGLVFFADEPPAGEALEALRPHVFSAEYAAIRAESRWYRYAFLGERLGIAHGDVSWRLLLATWEVDEDPARYDRYARELLARLDTDIAESSVELRETWLMLKGELLRRTAQFEAAGKHFTEVAANLATDHFLQPIVGYELELIAAEDSSPHQVP